MKLAAFCAASLVAGSAFAADSPPQPPADPCKSGLPWVLPKVEQGFDVSEQYLLSGATTPVQLTVCHCTPKTPNKPTPHVWVNVTKKVEDPKKPDQSAGGGKLTMANDSPSLQELEKAWKAAKGRTQFEFVNALGNTVVVSRLAAPACLTTAGLSVLVMHSSTEEDRVGTSWAK